MKRDCGARIKWLNYHRRQGDFVTVFNAFSATDQPLTLNVIRKIILGWGKNDAITEKVLFKMEEIIRLRIGEKEVKDKIETALYELPKFARL
jgi:hypothetical protein